ncbi:chorismate mutase [Metabacillus arenae]|uniref:chorismate mutase n=1 Tax=Metabacillus arenae TaxID=2771434 RepID=A0A926NBS7_9BACI|nr:chorismate mutase [Metabacillus arenae]MBD1378609.1 chorismate mutase [Metabacillus arenae]
MIRGVRGATTVEKNNSEEILDATKQLLKQMIELNNIKPYDVAQILVSATSDVNSTFPAKALRSFDGWQYVPIMCMKEMDVPDGLARCIRVMMTINTDIDQKEIQHVYLKGAVLLRPDLSHS